VRLLNTYPLFAEKANLILNGKGSFGYVIPSGFFMDDTTSPLFRNFFENKLIHFIYDFENKAKVFQNVHGQYRFCLLTIRKSESGTAKSRFLFFLQNIVIAMILVSGQK
jgi:hypothetical protein